MKSTYILETKQGKNVYWVRYNKKNRLNETMLIQLVACDVKGCSLPRLWKKNGYTSCIMESWWSISTFIYDENGNCYSKYNPQHCYDKRALNFDYVLEVTRDNAITLLKECEKRFIKGGK